jgi:hypothetical protein
MTVPDPARLKEYKQGTNVGVAILISALVLVALGFAVIVLSTLHLIIQGSLFFTVAGVALFAVGIGFFGWSWKILS